MFSLGGAMFAYSCEMKDMDYLAAFFLDSFEIWSSEEDIFVNINKKHFPISQ